MTKCLPLTDYESSSITFKMFKPVKEKQKYTQPTQTFQKNWLHVYFTSVGLKYNEIIHR